ncbi:head maturation protease, ClpP-related, partial [Enterovibrio norvegicus]|uniref:head maturation protease, ClpP-related n=1 Tax=Enterovibrio norvegicus TaxID=188144 RepID=UPI001F5287C8
MENLTLTPLAAAMKKTPILMTPKAMATTTPSGNGWFSINAAAAGTAEIYIYDEIGGWGISARQFATELKALGDIHNITLRIHSPGGDVFEGMAIYNLLDQHPARITVHIDGLAASMASVIAMAGDTVLIPENAMMMIHKPWSIAGGDANDLRQHANLLDQVEKTLSSAYTKKTGKSDDEIAAMLAVETWLTGAEAVEHGFADSVIEKLHAAACFNSNRTKDFDNMPKQLTNLMTPRAQVTPPAAPAPSTPEPTAPNNNPAPAVVDNGVAAIQARNNQIRDLFANFGGRHAETMNAALADVSMTFEQVKDSLLAELGRDT